MDAADGWRVALWILGALGGLSALFVGLLAWLGSYHVGRLDNTIVRMSDIREKYVTREEFMSAFSRSDDTTRGRHNETVQWLRRIEDTVKENADEARHERQSVAAAVQDIAIKVATLIGRDQAKGGT